MAFYLLTFSRRRAEAAWVEQCCSGLVGVELWEGCWLVEVLHSGGVPEERWAYLGAAGGFIAQPLDLERVASLIAAGTSTAGRSFFHTRVAPLLVQAQPARSLPFRVTWLGAGEDVFGSLVHGFRERPPTDTVTRLCDLMLHHGSDKSLGWHNYTPFYTELLQLAPQPISTLLEIGLGTNNPDVPSNMGPDGKPGASLRGWRDYLPGAQIYGADVDRRILFDETNIRTGFVDQLRPETFDTLWDTLGQSEFDVIVDDGLHTLPAAAITLDRAFPRLREGGIYIVEDVIVGQGDDYAAMARARDLDGFLLFLPHIGNKVDNAIMVARA